MEIKETALKDAYVLTPRVIEDERGYFFESYNKRTLKELGITGDFVQDNESLSSKGTLRGLHLQFGEMAQAKFVSVPLGSVLDVIVDCRKKSPTFAKWTSVELNAQNKKQLYVPRGFAHSFLVTSDKAIFQYKCDNFYSPEHETGINWADNELNITWPDIGTEYIVSDKDQNLSSFKEFLGHDYF